MLVKSTPGVNFINMLTHSFYTSKCSCTQLLFHQQYCTQLYQYTQLEVIHNFYPVRSVLCPTKIITNLRMQKLLIEGWWNWHLDDQSKYKNNNKSKYLQNRNFAHFFRYSKFASTFYWTLTKIVKISRK